jgi:hypothetical protein
MPFDIKAFLTANADKLTPEDRVELERGYLRQSDYDRNLNKLKQQVQERIAVEDDYHRQIEEQRQYLETAYGPLDQIQQSNANPNVYRTANGQFLSAAQVQEIARTTAATAVQQAVAPLQQTLQQQQQQLEQSTNGSLILAAKLPSFARQYETSYGKDFDGVNFIQFVNDNQLADLDVAFKLYTVDPEKERLKTQHDKDIAAAREEGARDFATRFHLPIDATPQGQSILGRRGPAFRPINQQPAAPTAIAPITPLVAAPVAAQSAPQMAVVQTGVPAVAQAAASDLAARMQQNFQNTLTKP